MENHRLPVTLLTGFLGSGKTTILNHLVRNPALARTLVIINEFGAIGLDHDLMSYSDEDIAVQMSSGCLCCTTRGDLVRTLKEAVWRFSRDGKTWFDRVVIETTGLADPAPVLHTLMTDRAISRKYRLDGVIATVDAVAGMDTLDKQAESVKQVAVADRLLLTKTDLAAPETIATLTQRLKALNPGAPVIQVVEGVTEPETLLDVGVYNPETKSVDVQRWLNAEAVEAHTQHGHHDHHQGGHHHDVNRHDDRISAVCLTIDVPISEDAFDKWLERLVFIKGLDLLRVKGIVNIKGQESPMVVHGVQHVFHRSTQMEAWPSEDLRSRIVIIGRDLDEDIVRDHLALFTQVSLEAI